MSERKFARVEFFDGNENFDDVWLVKIGDVIAGEHGSEEDAQESANEINVAIGAGMNDQEKFKMIHHDATASEFLQAARHIMDGEPIPVPDGEFIQTCCDCGLTHSLKFDRESMALTVQSKPEYTEKIRAERPEIFKVKAAYAESVEGLVKALDMILVLVKHETNLPKSAENGVTDSTGTMDEGIASAGKIIYDAEEALAVFQGDAVKSEKTGGEAGAVAQDAAVYGQGIMKDGRHVSLSDVYKTAEEMELELLRGLEHAARLVPMLKIHYGVVFKKLDAIRWAAFQGKEGTK